MTSKVTRETRSIKRKLGKRDFDYQPPIMPNLPPSTTRAITGSLPLDIRGTGASGALVPAVLFAPTHLRAAASYPQAQSVGGNTSNEDITRSRTLRMSVKPSLPAPDSTEDDSEDDSEEACDEEFLERAQCMLSDSNFAEIESRFKVSSTDASYDFNEYIFLRNPDDPFAQGLTIGSGASQVIPSDPRFKQFVREAQNGTSGFVEYASLPVQGVPQYLLTERMYHLQSILSGWWFSVCAIRAFNRLNRYSRTEIKAFFNYGFSPEAYYGLSLNNRLSSIARADAQTYLETGNVSPTGPLQRLLTVAFWEDVLVSVFQQAFDDNDIRVVDPSAPDGEYPFDPFPSDEILFGVRVVHRQTWRLLDYSRGDLVKTIPLGPKESQKTSVRVVRRRKNTRTTEEASSFETTAETSTGTKDTSEVIDEASLKLNAHAEAEAGVDIFSVVTAKVSVGLSRDMAASSKQTKNRLNELMEKTASRMKRDTKVTVSTETEDTFEENRSSELTNPNDEIAITYLYHRLQQRYWVSTEIAEVHSVVFVPEPLPAWEDIDEDWVRQHGDVIAGALLDPICGPTLAAIRKEPATLAYSPTPVFTNAANAGINAAVAYRTFTGGGAMPDLLASGQQCFERDYERRNTLAMDQARRQHQTRTLLTHIRRNILHYMRAIWASEDYDQRMQRYSRMRVPTTWRFVPRTPTSGTSPASPLEVEGVFMPDSGSARPLTEVIDPIGPIGFLFNCAIYQMRDDPKLVNLHQALSYLRATYVRFAVTVSISAASGVTFRQAVATAPRSFSVDYTFTYRSSRRKWLVPIPGRAEGDWIEVKALPDGSLEALGLRIWLDGTPVNMAALTIRVRATGDLEDPHLRLVQILHPLPAPGDEALVFTDSLLREMVDVLPGLVPSESNSLTWASLTDAQKAKFRERYHRFLMLRESGRLVTLDTANVVLDLEISATPALEPFKRLHRYLDVKKAYEDLRRNALDNTRRERLLKKGSLGDPDIERVTLVGARKDLKDVIAIADDSDE